MKNRAYSSVLVPLCLLAINACSEASAEDEASASDSQSLRTRPGVGAIFTMSNAADGNSVLAFHRSADGTLEPAGEHTTGGLGSGASLNSQGSVTLTEDGRFLLVVNAGSNEVSSFIVRGTQLILKSRVASGGNLPTSVATRNHLVYVLNAGPGSNINGYWLDLRGVLHDIPGSSRALSSDMPSAAQVAIAPAGLGVVVTEKATNLIDTFSLRPDGTLSGLESHTSVGSVPYGFDISSQGIVVVSEAAAQAVSSYSLRPHAFETVSASVGDFQKAPCWLVITRDGRFAYTANAASSSISGYSLMRNGTLGLLDPGGVTASLGAGATPLDLATDSQRHLYAMDAGNHAIDGFSITSTGALTPATMVADLPTTAVGLAAY
ncbi:MAG: lactonase family protein [Myxococcales bacterium]